MTYQVLFKNLKITYTPFFMIDPEDWYLPRYYFRRKILVFRRNGEYNDYSYSPDLNYSMHPVVSNRAFFNFLDLLKEYAVDL